MMNNINPRQLVGTIMKSKNPQQMVMNLTKGNPVFENMIALAQHNDIKGVETVAKNVLKERGFDFDKEFNSFRKTFGL